MTRPRSQTSIDVRVARIFAYRKVSSDVQALNMSISNPRRRPSPLSRHCLPILALMLWLPVLVLAQAPGRSSEVRDGETFDTWQVPGDAFRMYCRRPREADPAGIDNYYSGFRSVLPELVDFFGVDVLEYLSLYQRNGPSLRSTQAGSLLLQFGGGWGAGGWEFTALATVEAPGLTTAGGQALDLQPLAFGGNLPAVRQSGGSWYDPSDSGWGLSLDSRGDVETQILYFYDGAGRPRWVLGARNIADQVTAMQAYRGYCLGCPRTDITHVPAGEIRLQLQPGARSGVADIDVDWPVDGSRWLRDAAQVQPITDPLEFRD